MKIKETHNINRYLDVQVKQEFFTPLIPFSLFIFCDIPLFLIDLCWVTIVVVMPKKISEFGDNWCGNRVTRITRLQGWQQQQECWGGCRKTNVGHGKDPATVTPW